MVANVKTGAKETIRGGEKMLRGLRAGYPQLLGCGLNLLTEAELAEIHRATLDVLNDTGLMVLNDEAQEIFYSHGCPVDRKSNIVRIPPHLVEEAIVSTPSSLLLAARDPRYDIVLEGARVAYTSFGVAVMVLDLETGEVRESTNKDLAESAILVDAAESADFFLQSITPRDVPIQTADLVAAETCLTYCTKHFSHGELVNGESVKKFFEMGVAIVGSAEEMRRRPVCSTVTCPIAPLQLSNETCEIIIESARLGIPCDVASMPLAGGTAPVTIAGAMVIVNCEALGGIVLSQLTKKGAPVMYGCTCGMLDLRSGSSLVGSPEFALINGAAALQAQYYNLPSYIGGT
jgi:trimethylamine--corrinoid protein Co-methyltransferase